MRIAIPFECPCLHSLPVRTYLHAHRYRIVLHIDGPIDPESGFVINMELIQERINPDFEALRGKSLNGHPLFGEHPVGRLPTCEYLAEFFAERYVPVVGELSESAKLIALEVELINKGEAGDDDEFGLARWEAA